MSDKKLSFEEGLKLLENIISQLEENNINLDDMLSSYEKGMDIVKKLQSELNTAETKLKVLQNGEIKEIAQEDALD